MVNVKQRPGDVGRSHTMEYWCGEDVICLPQIIMLGAWPVGGGIGQLCGSFKRQGLVRGP